MQTHLVSVVLNHFGLVSVHLRHHLRRRKIQEQGVNGKRPPKKPRSLRLSSKAEKTHVQTVQKTVALRREIVDVIVE